MSLATRARCYTLACRDERGIKSTIPLELRRMTERDGSINVDALAREIKQATRQPACWEKHAAKSRFTNPEGYNVCIECIADALLLRHARERKGWWATVKGWLRG